MKFRIIAKKLLFVHHLTNLEDQSLAKEVLALHDHHNLPGLMAGCKDYFQKYQLPGIFKEPMKINKWKSLVKKKMHEANSKELKSEIQTYRKLEKSDLLTEAAGRQPYTKDLQLSDARTKFKHRTQMSQYVKMNFSSDVKYAEELWRCNSCETSIDSQSHVLWCPSYASLREGKHLDSDQDLCEYLREVFKTRHRL